jgi:predicted dehydrogenase
MKVGIVGLGYWGPNLLRNFLATDGVEGVVCCDALKHRTESIRKQFRDAEVISSCSQMLARSDVDAIVLATPAATHFPLGMKALEAGKHLLVEKPLTMRTAHAELMVTFAERQDLRLMVDHTFVYTGSVQKVKNYVMTGELGELMYFDSVRINLGMFQRDVNVLWDLAAHDISIMDFLISRPPEAVTAVGASHFNGKEDIAYLTLFFPDNLIAHFHVNWVSPVKVRKILIGGTKQMVVYDDMEASDKVKVYDKGVDITGSDAVHAALVQYRSGDMLAPNIDHTEALQLVAKEFVEAVVMRRAPLTDGWAGLNVVRILEAAEKSLHSGGELVRFAPGAFKKEHARLAFATRQLTTPLDEPRQIHPSFIKAEAK